MGLCFASEPGGGLARVSHPQRRREPGIEGPETRTSGVRRAAGLEPSPRPRGPAGQGHLRGPNDVAGGHRGRTLLNDTQRSSLTGAL